MTPTRLTCLVLPLILAAGSAHAAERSWTVDGKGLLVSSPCARTVEIVPTDGLSGQVEVLARADRAEEIERLVVEGGSRAEVRDTERNCRWRNDDDRPSLAMTIRVPRAVPVEVRNSMPTDYRVGDVGGPLTLDISGPGDLEAASARPLDLDLSGPGDVEVGVVEGPLKAKMSGPGDLTIGSLTAPTVEFILSGPGNADLGKGSVGSLSSRQSGPGDLRFSGDVTDATLRVSGPGNVRLEEGNIGRLKASISGPGDVRVGGDVRDADLETSGPGGITIARVTGTVSQNSSGPGGIRIGR